MSRHRFFPPAVFVPMVGNTGAADEADVAIDHEHFTVRAVVQSWQVVPAEWRVPADLAAGLGKFTKGGGPGIDAAEGVDHHADFDAGAGAFGQNAR